MFKHAEAFVCNNFCSALCFPVWPLFRATVQLILMFVCATCIHIIAAPHVDEALQILNVESGNDEESETHEGNIPLEELIEQYWKRNKMLPNNVAQFGHDVLTI